MTSLSTVVPAGQGGLPYALSPYITPTSPEQSLQKIGLWRSYNKQLHLLSP